MAMRILYLVPHVPNPTKARSYFHVRGLHEAGHEVVVATLVRNETDQRNVHRLQEVGISVLSAGLSRLQAGLNSLRAVPAGLPLQATFMWSSRLMHHIHAYLAQHPPDVIHVEHLRMTAYGLRLVKNWPVLWDAVDTLAPLYQQASALSSSRFLRWVSRLESPRLDRHERWLVEQFPLTLVISREDQARFRFDDSVRDRVRVALPGLPITPLSPAPRHARTLVFTGTLNYHPNVASVLDFAQQVFPHIQHECPDVKWQIVGANPVPAVRALQSSSIEVTGFVPSVAEYLQRATAAVAPILYATGMQNKVIEAFLTATPVVASPVAVRGLDVRHDEHVLIAETPADFAVQVLRLLRDPDLAARIGQAGRQYVERNHDLAVTTQHLVQMYHDLLSAYQR